MRRILLTLFATVCAATALSACGAPMASAGTAAAAAVTVQAH
jgi:hypothetical protein